MPCTIILRPVYNRPEMLKVSLNHEIRARQQLRNAGIADSYMTLFLIEYGTPETCLDVISDYPFPSIQRKRGPSPSPRIITSRGRRSSVLQNGLTRNIMEGMKEGFDMTDNHVIILEDDIMVHDTYFVFLERLLAAVPPFTIISSQYRGMHTRAVEGEHSGIPAGADPSAVERLHDYCPWGPLIRKDFFDTYIRPFASETYYSNRQEVITGLDKTYGHLKDRGYKYSEGMHNEQAGLINRMADLAMIEQQRYIYAPQVDRTVHTGFYGANRGKGRIAGLTFASRCRRLERAIRQNRLEELNTSRRYTSYPSFSSRLQNWDGTIRIRETQ
ncbi:hypothetical protein HUN82_07510 [Prosthecochloris sp. DSM 1685]|nr:hypothetical protein [Prosthecochloris ethylica]NUK47980.1 hypothetical protein [Prosthecochloris ethylica]